METQSYSVLSIPAGCIVTQQDEESIPDNGNMVALILSTESKYMRLKAPIFLKLFVRLKIIFRQKCKLKYTFLKAIELHFWLAQTAINRFRHHLTKITRELNQISPKHLILRGYTIFLKVLAGFVPHRQKLEKTHNFLFGDYPKETGSRTDV